MKTISKMFRAGLGFVLIGAFLTAMAAATLMLPSEVEASGLPVLPVESVPP